MCEFFHVSCDLVFLCYVTFLASRPFICIFMCMLELTCMIYYLLSLKVTSKQLNSHGDGGHPAFGDDSDKAGENGRVDVVPGVVVVICISHKNLDLTQAETEIVYNHFTSLSENTSLLAQHVGRLTLAGSSSLSVYSFHSIPLSLYCKM